MSVDDRLAPDRVFLNGKIITVDSENSIVEAIAVKDGIILATGTTEEIKSLLGEKTRIIELDGKTVLPGFIDTHSHPGVAARTFLEINCISPPTRSIKEILSKIKKKAKEIIPGEWIRAINYNQLKLEEKRHITREELDDVAPLNPVIITRLTGHLYILNSKGLEVSKIDRNTPDPPGGLIERDEDGNPTGLLNGLAGSLALLKIPPYTLEEIKDGLKKVYDQYSAWGFTSVHDPGTTAIDFRAYKQLLEEGVKQVRIQMMMRTHRESPRTTLEEMMALGIESGFGDDWLKIMSLKIMGDGTGSGGTAGVYKPQKRGDSLGLFMTEPEEMKDIVIEAQKAGIRVCIHSIVDRAIYLALDSIEAAQEQYPVSDMRHRIEHNSICTPKQLKRIKELGVNPASSIGYMWSIGDDYYDNFVEERVIWCHPHKTMIEMGIIAGGNCDYPITDANPMIQIYEAVTRKTSTGLVVGIDEAISVMDAIRVYTYNGAYLEKEEHKKGSIELGKFADFVVIDRDILSTPVEEIKNIKVLKTIVDGQIIFNYK
jgi:predicted amidohydrolase YtcJ